MTGSSGHPSSRSTAEPQPESRGIAGLRAPFVRACSFLPAPAGRQGHQLELRKANGEHLRPIDVEDLERERDPLRSFVLAVATIMHREPEPVGPRSRDLEPGSDAVHGPMTA